MAPLVDLARVGKAYGEGPTRVVALQDVTFAVDAGEFVAVTGPSGSGKSTLLSLLGCLDLPTAGEVRLAPPGMPPVATSALSDDRLADLRGAAIGFVFQSFNLLPRLTALQNVALPLSYVGRVRPVDRAARAQALLEGVGLGARLHHLPAQLSGGERQRVAVARALVNDPPLLLADEPTGNLDTETGRQIIDLFHGLREEGRTVILVTHDAAIAATTDRAIRLRDGRLEVS